MKRITVFQLMAMALLVAHFAAASSVLPPGQALGRTVLAWLSVVFAVAVERLYARERHGKITKCLADSVGALMAVAEAARVAQGNAACDSVFA